MKTLRKWLRNAFGFSGSEINGFLVLVPLMVVLVCSEPAYRVWLSRQTRPNPDDIRMLDSLILSWNIASGHQKTDFQKDSLFQFDPNTASVAHLEQLGFSGSLAKRIVAYRQKGGTFRVKADLLKIYGLDSALYHQLYDSIGLPSNRFVATDASGDRSKGKDRFQKTKPHRKPQQEFDINTADTTQLKSIYGIGSILAARIVKFRSGLGGFIRPGQLYEVYGLDSAVVQRLVSVSFVHPAFVPYKINLNTAGEKELSRHPYIRYRIASMLVNYRLQHGDFLEAGDIKKLAALKPDEADKMLPYLKVRD